MSVRLVHADWLEAASALEPGSIDFLYADPPFNTGLTRRTPASSRRARASFEDSWPSASAYVAWLRARLEATLPALGPSSTLALHVDFRTCHHVRVMLDDLLGEDRFVNHLIWHYGLGGSSPRRFARKHDDILVYALDPRRYYFRAPMVPASSRRLRGRLKKATDVIDIPAINNMAGERTGYPTQKPEALLRVLVGAFCPPGGRVLDPCCGSGTTLACALALGCAGVGFDVSPRALGVARRRLGLRRGGGGDS